MIIWTRQKIEVCDDPQRRCYNGVWYKSKMVWSAWKALGYPKTTEDGERRIKDWQAWDKYITAINKTNIEREYQLTDGPVPCST
jgi:hypothetical protein